MFCSDNCQQFESFQERRYVCVKMFGGGMGDQIKRFARQIFALKYTYLLKYLPSNIPPQIFALKYTYLLKYLPSDMYICTNTFHQISEQIYTQIFAPKYVCLNIFLHKYLTKNISAQIFSMKHICANIFPQTANVCPHLYTNTNTNTFPQLYALKYLSPLYLHKYFPSNISPALFGLKFTYTNIPKWI